ncbi:MAG: hypothetical protein M3404_08690 [Actinomycetota bacterium]|nr:hypothetical protein [Actinomycetota bacterium]
MSFDAQRADAFQQLAGRRLADLLEAHMLAEDDADDHAHAATLLRRLRAALDAHDLNRDRVIGRQVLEEYDAADRQAALEDYTAAKVQLRTAVIDLAGLFTEQKETTT